MKSEEIRTKFLKFFEAKGHVIISSASLVPENDPTTLFTGSGMQSLLPYLLGQAHPGGTRLVNSQKSFRAEDMEEVGDNRHTTFFEMLGNWSFGDYFKKEQIRWIFEFLTEEAGLDPLRLYVTAFIGDEKAGVPKDTETASIWKQLFQEKGIDAKEVNVGSEEDGSRKGMDGGRIFFYGKKNWWNRGKPSPETTPVGDPAGPDSEMFYDFGTEHNKDFGERCHPNCDCGRFMEVGNSVFMQYVKQADGSFKELPKKNVDFGGGLERITAAANNNPDIFCVDTLSGIIQQIETWTGKKYADEMDKTSFRIVADHLRAAVFMIDDGVLPGNTEQGYGLRRLLRRAVVHAEKLGAKEPLSRMISTVAHAYPDSYAGLKKSQADIAFIVEKEEEQFRKTLERGRHELRKLALPLLERFEDGSLIPMSKVVTNPGGGERLFHIFSTYGFPLELSWEVIKEERKEHGFSLLPDETIERINGEFTKALKAHQDLSRAGAEKKFKGGLADTSDMSVRYHTATHLLHKALRDVLGESVFQKGSNITPERLRFDFSYSKKMTLEEIARVETIVNEKIEAALPVSYEDIPIEEAGKRGAVGLFEEKYGEKVRVYKIGEGNEQYSLEFCGGPHVKNTSELGHFKITKEEAVAAGVRRIKATLEPRK